MPISYYAIALTSLLTGIYTLPLNAQITTLKDNSLEGIEAQTFDWNFISEESMSIKDNIQELGEYRISESDAEIDLELVEEKKWGNRGDVEDYSIEVEIYDY